MNESAQDRAIDNGKSSAGIWEGLVLHPGLSKREAFAMAAMQGLMADPNMAVSFEAFAQRSILMADALLLALEETR